MPRTSDAYRYSRVAYLAERARRRIPRFVREYLDSGTGDEYGVPRNRTALNAIEIVPRYLPGDVRSGFTLPLPGRRLRRAHWHGPDR